MVAWRRSETFRRIVIGTFEAIRHGAGVAVDWVVDKLASLAGFFTRLPGTIKTAIRPVTDILLWPFKTAFNAIASLWNNTVGRISIHVPDWVPKIGGKGFDVPDIPTLGHGGIVPATPGGRIVRVSEAGRDEAIIPLPRRGHRTRLGGAGGTTINVNVNGAVGDPRSIARMIHAELIALQNGGYRLGFRT